MLILTLTLTLTLTLPLRCGRRVRESREEGAEALLKLATDIWNELIDVT